MRPSSDEVRSKGLRLPTFPDFTQPNGREKLMKRIAAVIIVGLICSTLSIATSAQQSGEQAGAATPRGVVPSANYPGGISNGVRAVLAAQGEIGGSGAASIAQAPTSPSGGNPATGKNVKMNDDSYPPMPPNE